jgi:osmotically-inducible protein OsmY
MLDAVLENAVCHQTHRPARAVDSATVGGARLSPAHSDRALLAAVAQALASTGHASLRKLDIEVNGGIVVLWGEVTSYYQKQLAQETAQRVNGAGRVANGIEVICVRSCERTLSGR